MIMKPIIFLTNSILWNYVAVILDEGHLQVKNNLSLISRTLMNIATKRRISLSGTPLQNNLNEYLRMVDWVRPGFLGSMSSVENKYVNPIMSSLTSDASPEEKEAGDKMLRELFEKLNPFVQRLDSSVLEQDLPHMQQAVLYIKQTKAQVKLFRAFQKYQKKSKSSANSKSFLEMYQKLVRFATNIVSLLDDSTNFHVLHIKFPF